MKTHPCLTCGACCASFRVSFYWAETLPESYHVPEDLTQKVTSRLASMKTDSKNRCLALEGEIGKRTSCAIYSRRSSTCREFKASFEDGQRDEYCDRARAKFDLPPLTLDHWRE